MRRGTGALPEIEQVIVMRVFLYFDQVRARLAGERQPGTVGFGTASLLWTRSAIYLIFLRARIHPEVFNSSSDSPLLYHRRPLLGVPDLGACVY